MIRFTAALMAVLMALSMAPAFAQEDYDSMYTLTERCGFRLGGCLSYNQLRDQKYLDLLKAHFNSVTMTNEMKAYTLLDQRASKARTDGMPAMNYSMADQMISWARQNGLGVRGHVLVWDAYMCDWFFREGYDSKNPYADQETVQKRTEYYIDQVIRHFEDKFPGTVYCWDVVNEAVGDSAGEYAAGDPRHLRTVRSGSDNLFQKYMGDNYVALSFLYARNTVEAIGADIALYYNDYNAYFGDKAKAILALAESVNSFTKDEHGNARKLLDGIGMQGYIGGYGTQQGCLEPGHISMIKNAILGYAGAGLQVQITEMAVRNFDPDRADRHAEYYGNLFKMFRSLYDGSANPLNCVAIWGLTDHPREPKGTYVYNLNSPYGGLVDENLEYKDAFVKVYEALSQ